MTASSFSATRACVLLVCACLMPGARPAIAGKSSFSVSPSAAVASTAGTSIATTVALPAAGANGFHVNIVLPKGYKKNTPAKVVFYARTAPPACTARIVPTALVRYRLGKPLASGLSGVTATGGSPLLNLQGDGALRPVTIEIGPGSGLNGQKARDAMNLTLTREANAASDTCGGTVFIYAINVIYTTP